MQQLSKDITYLPGVGPKRAKLLNSELQIFTYGDLLYYFPYKYVDRSKIYSIAEINTELTHIQLKGKIKSFRMVGERRGKRLVASFNDNTGAIELVWFKGWQWVQNNIEVDKEYIIFGKPTIFNRQLNIAHPEIETTEHYEKQFSKSLQPQYNTTEKLKNSYIHSKTIAKFQYALQEELKGGIRESLPDYVSQKYGLQPLSGALKNIHFPADNESLRKANYRIKFEELFILQLNIVRLKVGRNNQFKGHIFKSVGTYFHSFYEKHLPFELTGAQKKVIKEIRRDMGSGLQMNRILQGDVGSGKTLVALMNILIALDNGYQACLMAPTEILAQQHYRSISELLFGLPVNVRLLTGSTKKKIRDEIRQGLHSGELHILIGTHALLEDYVQFSDLGLVVIDEQHRFGVAQRAKLWQKNTVPPHVLVMTATPIPRTLAMTVYGDLDVSVIDELPPGRKPIQTVHYYDSKRLSMFGFLRRLIEAGQQIYVVYPLIKESEKLDYKDLEDGYEAMVRAFPPPDYVVACVHGQMKPQDKDDTMNMFKAGKINILVATTVIEVGVDVPNATVMVIESAERFGLSQLHQLRGRVGRGGDQSYCILMTSYKLSNDAKKRLETMVRTNDGFEIAEVDMKLRGPGDLDGTQQSGLAFNLKLANLAKDSDLVQYTRDAAEELLANDPALEKPENSILLPSLNKQQNISFDWRVIS
ncbi:MAG: ATP-dependent DNA helicase RecG [Bacteroidetes bacterium]|nr:ATP-dependent DNA helicase RecG [Bacteroidota bacterium]